MNNATEEQDSESNTSTLLTNNNNNNSNNISDNYIPLTPREEKSWIALAFSSEPIASAISSFVLPLLLDYLAFQAGSSAPLPDIGEQDSPSKLPDFDSLDPSDWYVAGSCIPGNTTFYPPSHQLYYSNCFIGWSGSFIRVEGFTFLIIAISVALQAFCFISFGAFGDYGKKRKTLLLSMTGVGFILCIGLSMPFDYNVTAVFAILLTIVFGLNGVYYNSFLPVLASCDPNRSTKDSTNRLSSLSSGIGYVGGLLVSGVCAGLIIAVSEPLNYKIGCLFAGIWWVAFSIPAFLYLKDRPTPELPKGTSKIVFSWKRLIDTLKSLPKIHRTFLYLLAFTLWGDGVGTIISVIVLFAKNELKVDQLTLGIQLLIVTFMASVGNYVFYALQTRFKLQSKTMLLSILVGYTTLSVYGLLGLAEDLPIGFKNASVIPLNDKCVKATTFDGKPFYSGQDCSTFAWEVYMFSTIMGFLLGPLNSYARTLFSELVPQGHESEFFSLFAISDKSTSFIGPLIVTLIIERGGTLRYSFFYFLVMFVLPFPIIFFMNFDRGKSAAERFSVAKSVTLPYQMAQVGQVPIEDDTQ